MALRYLGNLVVSVAYDDRGFYRASVGEGGEFWRGTVRPPAGGFGPSIAYDSPLAYDAVARAAVSFALDERPDFEDAAYAGPHGGEFRRPSGRPYARLH